MFERVPIGNWLRIGERKSNSIHVGALMNLIEDALFNFCSPRGQFGVIWDLFGSQII